ncbi:ABC transporter ATP-binding protein [Siminovitchia sp. FSL H7-0308]|uniref:ABC transporter ATP-binding protein n=1 Tax=Siminovitchia sp. FSL H7-0308 TaxID=2921432 RepID=UPI0030EF0F39
MLTVNINSAGYDKKNIYLKNIKFKINKGEIVGLIGANGAGKSTTIKSIIGTINEFDGTIEIQTNLRFSYIPEEPIIYENLTLWEHLSLASSSYQLKDCVWIPKANELLQLFKLDDKKDAFPVNFSKGMKQKTLIVLSFMTQSDIYIIDEPFIGLDPIATIISLLILEKNRGASILMSTHVLDTAEKLCDRFILLSNGQILCEGTLSKVRNLSGQSKDSSLLDCFNYLLEGESNNE